MDCTGSMGSYISAAKQNIERIVQRLTEQEHADLRFGLVSYRDHPPQDQSYVVKSFPFTTELSAMQANLRTLSANGGGDGPEAVEAGLKAALEMDWRSDATKICIFIADAPPHGLGENGDGFPDGAPTGVDPLAVLDQMSMRGISVYTVGCQPALSHYRYATDFFIAAAERTNGQAVALESAAALADVIMGGAIEEMELTKLTDDVQRTVAALQQSEPELAEEEVATRVWRGLQERGLRTRQMKTAKLTSAHSALVSRATSLADAKSSLSAVAPSEEALGGRRRGRSRCASRSSPLELRSFKPAYRDEGLDVLECDEEDSDEELELPDEEVLEMACYRGGSSRLATLAGDRRGDRGASLSRMRAAPPPASSAAAPRVDLEEGEITMEQVSRLYGRGKKTGLW